MAADVIICLGLRRRSPRDVFAVRARVVAAEDAYRHGSAPYLIVSGGFTHDRQRSEAREMANMLTAVDPDAVILEEQSTTTVGNAYCCRDILRKRGWTSAMLVTSPYHAKRALYIFQQVMPEVKFSVTAANFRYGGVRHWIEQLREWLYYRDIMQRGVANARR